MHDWVSRPRPRVTRDNKIFDLTLPTLITFVITAFSMAHPILRQQASSTVTVNSRTDMGQSRPRLHEANFFRVEASASQIFENLVLASAS